jgi:hypothetical protein
MYISTVEEEHVEGLNMGEGTARDCFVQFDPWELESACLIYGHIGHCTMIEHAKHSN